MMRFLLIGLLSLNFCNAAIATENWSLSLNNTAPLWRAGDFQADDQSNYATVTGKADTSADWTGVWIIKSNISGADVEYKFEFTSRPECGFTYIVFYKGERKFFLGASFVKEDGSPIIVVPFAANGQIHTGVFEKGDEQKFVGEIRFPQGTTVKATLEKLNEPTLLRAVGGESFLDAKAIATGTSVMVKDPLQGHIPVAAAIHLEDKDLGFICYGIDSTIKARIFFTGSPFNPSLESQSFKNIVQYLDPTTKERASLRSYLFNTKLTSEPLQMIGSDESASLFMYFGGNR